MRMFSFCFILFFSYSLCNPSLVFSLDDEEDDDFYIIEREHHEHLDPYKEDLIRNGTDILRNIYGVENVKNEESLPLLKKIPTEIINLTAFDKNAEPDPLKSPFDYSSTDEYRQEYLSKITALSWPLVEFAKQTGIVHESGSFTIIDPDYKLYNFLLDYVKHVTGNNNPANQSWFATKNNFAYRRDPKAWVIAGSSHHKKNSPESQFGIDIRFEKEQTIYGLLPFEKRHILFGKLVIPGSDLPLLFVKFEEVGIGGGKETVAHSSNLMKPKVKKNIENSNREKDVHPMIIEKYKELTQKNPPKGIHVYEMVSELKNTPAFTQTIEEIYPNDLEDTHSSRTGNEIMLDLRNFVRNQ